MKITYMSDIHLEFGALNRPMPEGDILILDGDITLIGTLDPDDDLYQRLPQVRERTLAFIDQCRDSFKRVFYLIGNHEAYNYDLTKTPKLIRQKLRGVELLENKAVALSDDVVLVGGTLWTDMNQGRDAWMVARGMNDFRIIHCQDKEAAQDSGYQTRVFRPDDAMKRFAKTKRFIAKTARANPNKIIVVATHHAPSVHGLNSQHVHNSRINHGYYTDLHSFIEGLPNIRYWVFGHTHKQTRFEIAQCTVLSNARGYIGHEHSADVFDPDCWFDPMTGESKDPALSDAKAEGEE